METSNWGVPGSTVEIYQRVFIPAMIGEWVPRVLAMANLRPGDRVLDIACGTGALTYKIAETVGNSGYVAGVDINPEMLRVATSVSGETACEIDWRECDAQILPFDADLFDAAFCQLGLMFMPDKVATLREMLRVVKPGGQVFIMVWGAIEKCPGQMAMSKTWKRLLGEEQAAGFSYQHSLSNKDELHRLMETAGLADVDIHAQMGTMRWESAEQLVRSYGALGHFPGDAILQAAAIQEVSQLLEGYTKADGLAYPIEAVLGRGTKPW